MRREPRSWTGRTPREDTGHGARRARLSSELTLALVTIVIAMHAGWTSSETPPLGAEEPAPGEARPAPSFSIDVGQQASLGSVVPCAVPLRWRLAGVDPRFEIDPSEAREAVLEAARLWEDAMGRRLFRHDPSGGFPVTFEFDDRQAMLLLRNRFSRELQDADDELGIRAAELRAMKERFEAVRAEYEERVRDLQRSTEEHNERVRQWNRQGGAPGAVRSDLQREERILAMERQSIRDAERELREAQQWLRTETERLNRGIEDRNRRAQAFQTERPLTASESGRYLESVRTRNGEVVSVEREIRVFRFGDREELLLVIAHELGHALGLGHAGEPGAVMSEVLPTSRAVAAEPGLQPRDVEMLRSRCPGL